MSFLTIPARHGTFYIEELALNAMSKVNRASLVHWVEALETNECCAHFNIQKNHVMQFLKRIMYSNIVLAKQIADVLRDKTSALLKPLKLSVFARIPDPNLQKIDTEQGYQVMRASLAHATYV